VNTPELLSNVERCGRYGLWSSFWEPHRLSPVDMMTMAVNNALVEPATDPGENAGEHFMTLARDRGLEVSSKQDKYRCAVNHAAIADIVTMAIRRSASPWKKMPLIDGWTSAALLHDGKPFRFLPVTHWTEERQHAEIMSWFGIGETAHYGVPMDLCVVILGPIVNGRRTGPFSRALTHPKLPKLRFKKQRGVSDDFKGDWRWVYREDNAALERQHWLQCMLDDNVLTEHLFIIAVPVPDNPKAIRKLAKQKLEHLSKVRTPEKQLSTCFSPLGHCPFIKCCHVNPEREPGVDNYNFIGDRTGDLVRA
jgi:hypothetical protein